MFLSISRMRINAASRALLTQVAAFPLSAATIYFLAQMHAGVTSVTGILIFQGAAAATIAAVLRHHVWWPPIHLLFPLAASVVHGWSLQPHVFLAGFLLFLGLFWTTFRTQVPFYPSGRSVWDAVLATLPVERINVVDVGSGMGGLVMHLARHRPTASASGIEAAPLPYLVSRLRSAGRFPNCRFRWGRYETIDFGEFDVVFAYLSPAAMPAIWEKARREMRPGTIFYSYEFDVPDNSIRQVIEVDGKRASLYRWTM